MPDILGTTALRTPTNPKPNLNRRSSCAPPILTLQFVIVVWVWSLQLVRFAGHGGPAIDLILAFATRLDHLAVIAPSVAASYDLSVRQRAEHDFGQLLGRLFKSSQAHFWIFRWLVRSIDPRKVLQFSGLRFGV